MELKNLKASFIFKSDICQEFNSKNLVFRLKDVVFTVYKHSPSLVNVTGIKDVKQIKLYKKMVENYFNQKVLRTRIDNSFFSRKQKKNVDLHKIYNFFKKNKIFHVNYNVELFSGMYLQSKVKGIPTLLLFHTGSYVIMGGKNLKTVYKCEKLLNKIISTFEKKKLN